jgi:Mn2+/Fe2+ NRAMP family transporter
VIADSPTGGASVTTPKKRKMRAPQSRVRQFLRRLGPGLITGASDDDPSGIGTYSQAGAQLG